MKDRLELRRADTASESVSYDRIPHLRSAQTVPISVEQAHHDRFGNPKHTSVVANEE